MAEVAVVAEEEDEEENAVGKVGKAANVEVKEVVAGSERKPRQGAAVEADSGEEENPNVEGDQRLTGGCVDTWTEGMWPEEEEVVLQVVVWSSSPVLRDGPPASVYVPGLDAAGDEDSNAPWKLRTQRALLLSDGGRTILCKLATHVSSKLVAGLARWQLIRLDSYGLGNPSTPPAASSHLTVRLALTTVSP